MEGGLGGLATHPSPGKEGKASSKTMGWLSKNLTFKKTKQSGAPSENGNGIHTPAVEPQSQDTLTQIPASPGSSQGAFSRPP